jgi:hypothetical protein
MARLCYIDGLVSTGNQIPFTILKRIFANIKLFPKNFINIFNNAVDNSTCFTAFCSTTLCNCLKKINCFTKKNKKVKTLKVLILL